VNFLNKLLNRFIHIQTMLQHHKKWIFLVLYRLLLSLMKNVEQKEVQMNWKFFLIQTINILSFVEITQNKKQKLKLTHLNWFST
jgi:hypothetical protein